METIKLPEKIYGKLEDLFDEWKKAHINDEYWEQTFPKCPCCGDMPPESFKESFTYDGYLSDSTDVKLLFIGRESNATNENKKPMKTEDETFWMKKVWENKDGKYYTYLNGIKEQLRCEDDNNCAYMNINKRGGYSQCDFTRLDNYVTVYGEYIKKEIELINPEIIVFLGVGNYKYREKLMEMIKDINKKIKCYEVPHPSARGKKDAYKEKLKNEIRKR